MQLSEDSSLRHSFLKPPGICAPEEWGYKSKEKKLNP